MSNKTPSKTEQDESYKVLGTGLRETPEDQRDFPLGGVYGVIDIKRVPMGNFNLPKPLVIKDQESKDFCAAFMATEMSEDQEGEELGADWQMAMIKELLGEWESWGSDLRTAILSLVKVGSVPKKIQDEFLRTVGEKAKDRNFLANWNNWPAHFKEIAKKYRKESLFAVQGPHDAFDNVRAALWQHKEDKCSVGLGVMWRYNWNECEGGIIPLEAVGPGEGHAMKAFDQVVKNGVQYLALQQSWGIDVGDRGIFYASREVFNAYFANFKLFMVKDLPVAVAKYLVENQLTIKNAWWVRIFIGIRDLFTRHQQA